MEAIKVKILTLVRALRRRWTAAQRPTPLLRRVQGDEDLPQSVRVELSSENDLFFHYMHFLDEAGFRTVQEQQKLMVDFADYTNVLISMLNNAIKNPHTHLAVFVMQRDGLARLDFIQNMEYKFLELLSVNFVRSPDEVVRQQICFRYNAMKVRPRRSRAPGTRTAALPAPTSPTDPALPRAAVQSRLAVMQARLQDVNNLVKIKNPSLLLQLQQKSPTGSGSGSRAGAGGNASLKR